MPGVNPLVAVLVLALTIVGQPSVAAEERPAAGGTGAAKAAVTIHVVSNGWHTSIVLARADLPAGAIPEAEDFPAASYLEFGWGDAEYFPARSPTFGMALSAALAPGPAVVHMVGLPAPPREVFPTAETIDVTLPPAGFRRLVDYLEASFARGGARRAEPSAPGLYSFSRFYPATGEFHLFNTCNTWIARGLAAAGLPVTVAGTLRAEELMAQLR
jgi:uncharacterized protein (TIGR02117 family)